MWRMWLIAGLDAEQVSWCLGRRLGRARREGKLLQRRRESVLTPGKLAASLVRNIGMCGL